MTPQEIFDRVARHLLTQNRQALDPGFAGNCRYRASDGLKCAVGCLIADEDYNPDMEGAGLYGADHASELLQDWLCKLGIAHHRGLLYELQSIHDKQPDAGSWPLSLREVASIFKLNAAVLDEFATDL